MHDNALKARQDSSYFTMDHINRIQGMTLEDAQAMLLDAVNESNAHSGNKAKAINMIHRAQDLSQLMIAATNFLLSCEGLSTGRGA